MPVSDMPLWPGFLKHVLDVLSDGRTRQIRDLTAEVADAAGLSEEQRLETTSSGDERYRGRIGFAVLELRRADAVERPRRGSYFITEQGRELLRHHPSGLGQRELLELPVYRQRLTDERGTRGQHPHTDNGASPPYTLGGPPEVAPKEQIADGVEQLHGDVANELLERLRSSGPDLLEHAVVDLLVTMGYGRRGERPRITGSGDGGLDGVIDQDPLGLGRIYVQAKRYAADNVVGRPAIQGFVGALHGQQASQGVFITTSSFSKEAGEYARHVNAAVVLMDGRRLTDLMIQYGVAVQTEQTYTVVKVDEDYFEL